jgi:hypothetical protein
VAAKLLLLLLFFLFLRSRTTIPTTIAPRMARPPTTPPTIPPIEDFFFVSLMKPVDPDEPLPPELAEEVVTAAEAIFDTLKPPPLPREAVGIATAVEAAALPSVSYTGVQVRPSVSPTKVVSKTSKFEEKVESHEYQPMDDCGTR